MKNLVKPIGFYLLLFLIIIIISEGIKVFKFNPTAQYMLYEPNIGIGDDQLENVLSNFGFKKTKSVKVQFDNNYKYIARLNDNNLIRSLADDCGVNNELGTYPSKFIQLTRNKKNGFVIVDFKYPLNAAGQCILATYNQLLREDYLVGLRKEKLHIENLMLMTKEMEFQKMLTRKLALLESLRLLQPEHYLKYHFWPLNNGDNENKSLLKSIYLSTLLTFSFLLIHCLIRK